MRLAILRGPDRIEVRVWEERGNSRYSFSQVFSRAYIFNLVLTERQLCAREAWAMRKQIRKFAAALTKD